MYMSLGSLSRPIWPDIFCKFHPLGGLYNRGRGILRHIGLLEADEDKIRKIRPKGTLFRILYVPREAIRP